MEKLEMKHRLYWRDDDISVLTKFEQFQFCHEIFQQFKVIHTIAVIAKDFEKNKEVVDYIKKNQSEFDIQLHCYEHFDHSKAIYKEIYRSINKGIEVLKKIFDVRPIVFYPPWNSYNREVERVCEEVGLKCMPEKISLDQYIRKEGNVAEQVVNFHYWYEPEVNDLYKALKIYTSK